MATGQLVNLPSLLFQVILDGRRTNYVNVASFALMIFDHSLTMQEEITLVWKSRLNVGKIIFLVYRYFGLVTQIFSTYDYLNAHTNLSFCTSSLKFQTVATTLILWFAEAILGVRVWILYGRSRVAGFLLGSLFSIGLTSTLFLRLYKISFEPDSTLLPFVDFLGCDITGLPIPSLLFASIIPSAISTTVLFLITSLKTFSLVRVEETMPVATLLFFDGLSYFAATFSVVTVNTFILHFARFYLKGIALSLLTTIPYIMACRLMLNIRSFIHSPPSSGTSALLYESWHANRETVASTMGILTSGS